MCVNQTDVLVLYFRLISTFELGRDIHYYIFTFLDLAVGPYSVFCINCIIV